MFHSARVKLTAWYVLLIMLISILFSVAFYNVSTREVQRFIDRIEFQDQTSEKRLILFRGSGGPGPLITGVQALPSVEALMQVKERLKVTLIMLNGVIIVVAGGAAYFLAGRTLRPIKKMIDEQSQFISNASHELRTPIATLRAEMEGSLLEKHISDKKARSLINSNLEELQELQELSNSLLNIAQVHTNHKDKTMQSISLVDVVTLATKKVTPLAMKKHITISVKMKETIIKGDKNSLVELFVILLDNAIKYSPQKSKILVASEEENSTVTIRVSDKGYGISEKDLPHIFERFYRADKSRSQTEGYGLGLSIAQKIVESHKGTITVASKEKKGTTFIIRLPLSTSS